MKQHYFCSTFYFWAVDTTLLGVIEKIKGQYVSESVETKRIATCNLFLVPLDIDALYDINFFRPVVKGAELIAVEKLFPELGDK